MAEGDAMPIKAAALAAALCMMMVASGVWHEADQKPTVLADDRDIFIKAQAAQQMNDYLKAFGGNPVRKAAPAHTARHEVKSLVKETNNVLPEGHRFKAEHAPKSAKMLNHWNAINDIVFPKRWANAKPAHPVSRKQQERQEMARINHVNAETIPAAHVRKLAPQLSGAAMLKHYNSLFDSTFQDSTSSSAVSKPSSKMELAHLKDLNDAVFPKEQADTATHWTATKQGLLAHYKELSEAAFPTEHFSHHAPMSGDQELAHYKALSESVNPGAKAAKKRRAHDSGKAELAHLKDLTSRVFPSHDSLRDESHQTARDSEAAELAGIHSETASVFPSLKGSRHHHAQTSDEELASLHRLSDSVVPTEHAARKHERKSAQEELEEGMKMVAGKEFKGKRGKAHGVKGVAVGSKLHAQAGHGAHPWNKQVPAMAGGAQGQTRNVV